MLLHPVILSGKDEAIDEKNNEVSIPIIPCQEDHKDLQINEDGSIMKKQDERTKLL